MKRIIFIGLALFSLSAASQTAGWMLTAEYGIGRSIFRDKGTSPLSYHGPGATLSLGAKRTAHWTQELRIEGMAALLEDQHTHGIHYSKTGGYGMMQYTATHPVKATRYHAGGGMLMGTDIRYNSSLGNSSLMITGIAAPTLEFGREWRWREKSRKAYGSIGLMPVALLLRPGYGYGDNYTATTNTAEMLLEDYEWAAKGLAGIRTEIGYERCSPETGNTLGAAYRWHYVSTGSSGIYRADYASHAISITFGWCARKHKERQQP